MKIDIDTLEAYSNKKVRWKETLFYILWEMAAAQFAGSEIAVINQRVPVPSVLQTSSGRC
jgi:hypothetical protein